MRRARSSERGSVAVIFAICVVLLFGLAALGVDLGNAMNRKSQVQADADLAALAGGGGLPATSLTPTSSDDIVLAVADYLISNKVRTDDGFSLPSKGVLAQKLVSNLASDKLKYGHVYYGYFDAAKNLVPSKNYVTVVTPSSRVNFGLAKAIGVSNTSVQSKATAGIKSIGTVGATLPFYAYTGCDWGQQIISHGTANSVPPTLYASGDNNGLVVTSPTSASPNANPNQVALNDTTTVLSLFGTGLTASTAPNDKTLPGVIALGLFKPDGSAPIEVAAGSFVAGSTATEIKFRLPASAASQDGQTFYLRVAKWVNEGNKNNPNYQKRWSVVSINMAYVNVGSATLFCNDDKSAGNFGSLTIFRTDSNNSANGGWLPLNIAKGIHIPNVLLNKYTETINTNSCGNGDSKAYQSDEVSSGVHVNCVVTDTGFPQNPASAGFITGVNAGTPGRLTAVSSGCGAANGKPPTRAVGNYTVNNEVLSCFFINTSTTVAQVSNSTYSGDVVISPAIYSSPRFFVHPGHQQAAAERQEVVPDSGLPGGFPDRRGPDGEQGPRVDPAVLHAGRRRGHQRAGDQRQRQQRQGRVVPGGADQPEGDATEPRRRHANRVRRERSADPVARRLEVANLAAGGGRSGSGLGPAEWPGEHHSRCRCRGDQDPRWRSRPRGQGACASEGRNAIGVDTGGDDRGHRLRRT